MYPQGFRDSSNPCHLHYMQHFDLGNRLLTGHRNPGSGLWAYGFGCRV